MSPAYIGTTKENTWNRNNEISLKIKHWRWFEFELFALSVSSVGILCVHLTEVPLAELWV